jgi:aryl-alcohol dehydrogenase-like predicted oxidoreductase
LGILKALDEVAAHTRANPTRVALAWMASRPGITAPIASATSVEQLQDLIAGVTLELDAESTALLDQASA